MDENDHNVVYKRISDEVCYMKVELKKPPDRLMSFLNADKFKSADCSLLSNYLSANNIIEMHLDNVFKCWEQPFLPLELFRCANLQLLTLRNNALDWLPADMGRLTNLECLVLTNNNLRNYAIPFTLTFCTRLTHLYLDNNLLDALPGFLLTMSQLNTVHRHGNHNYFKSTFMWYYTDLNTRILMEPACNHTKPKEKKVFNPESLEMLTVQAVIASKQNFFLPGVLPAILQEHVAYLYPKFNVCENCKTAKLHDDIGYNVLTFKNPYLGNSCVPFQHWACSMACAEAIEVPAHQQHSKAEYLLDQRYCQYIAAIQTQQRGSGHHSRRTCDIL